MRILIGFLWFVSSACAASPTAPDKGPHCDWSSPVADTQSTVTLVHEALTLTQAQRDTSIATHLPFGVPTQNPNAANERLLVQNHYVLNYDDDLRIPLWAAYRLQNTDIVTLTRVNSFRRDPRINDDNDASTCVDYKEGIFDQGHLVPRADMNRSAVAMTNTFIMSNMTPQHCAFNRGIWRILEGVVRTWAQTKGTIHIITGVALDRDGDDARDLDADAWRMRSEVTDLRRVAIPSHQYKIVLHERPNTFIETISLLIPNTDEKISDASSYQFLTDHITSIDRIEELTGIRLLPNLANTNPGKENAVTAFQAPALWIVDHGSWPTGLAGVCANDFPDM